MPNPTSNRIPRVALLIETTRSYTRDILSGVRSYLSVHGPWSSFVELRAFDSTPPPWLKTWRGDGILTRTHTQEMADLLAATGIPTVELRSTDIDHPFPFIGMDNRLIGRSVADHFLTRGYRHFAAYTIDNESFFRERNDNFVQAVEDADCRCHTLATEESSAHFDWETEQSRLQEWLGHLPKPLGLFATSDALAVRVLDACQRANLRVPEEVAVVGNENEETLCSFATPNLTSVAFDGETVGYRAAELLTDLMNGKQAPTEPFLVAPRGLVLRQSSDELMIGDGLVVRALRLIREGALENLTVAELSSRLSVSRSTLERRMKKAIGRSPKAEILRLRFRRVEELLRSSNLTIEVIAERCGFQHAHYLQTAFRERYGQTPTQYRKTFVGVSR